MTEGFETSPDGLSWPRPQPHVGEQEIKRAAVLRVRRFFYGPSCAPRLREQVLHFCSFGTIMKWEELRRVHTWD